MPELNNNSIEENPPLKGAPGDVGSTAGGTDINSFLNEVQKPTIAAQHPGFNPGAAQNAPAKPAGPVYTPPEGAKPLFDEVVSEGNPVLLDDGPLLDKAKTAAADRTLKSLLNFENYLSAMGFGFYAGTSDLEQFKRKEATTDELVAAFPEKYKEWVYSHFPEITGFALIYMMDKFEMRNIAVKIRKVNKANQAAAKDGEKVRRVASAGDANEERSNFTLYSDGYYRNNRRGEYIGDRGNNKNLLEKPSIADLEKILAVKGNRNRELLAKAFGWTEKEFAEHNID